MLVCTRRNEWKLEAVSATHTLNSSQASTGRNRSAPDGQTPTTLQQDATDYSHGIHKGWGKPYTRVIWALAHPTILSRDIHPLVRSAGPWAGN